MAPTSAPALRIEVRGVEPVAPAVVPALCFSLGVHASPGSAPGTAAPHGHDGEPPEVRALTLTTQVRIDATARAYDEDARLRLKELFGPSETWDRNLSSLLWTQTVTHVPAFTGSTIAPVTVPCTYDFDVAATKYLHGLPDGEVPLRLLFTGTVFYLDDGRLQAACLPWDTEAGFRMPVSVWKELMDRHFPRTAWIRLERDTFDRLYAHRTRHTLPGWDDAVRSLLETSGG
ncbi:DUF6084 family protein [Nonomuraea zeae]|uniref:Uncharacterized protein n=1 Tax=Nonomuraea zeae TaxID=1642303 RepID=A0A5S4FS51_9ACTN|nr:DUF6084 family protein [Nonomuraea zeae]TMR23498.1 hypothetical protein ETD85_47865 [Nonomuraea zeae]